MLSAQTKAFLLHLTVTIIIGLFLIWGYSITTGPGITLYQSYAHAFLPHITSGHITFGRLPIEYPLLSLVPMLLPLIGGDVFYVSVFIFFMLAVAIGIYLFLYYASSRGSAFAYLMYVIVGGACIAIGRLDLVVGLLILLSLYEADKKKYYSAYIFLALATMFKVVPLLLVLPVFTSEQLHLQHIKQRSIWRRYGGIGIYVLICFFIFALSVVIGGQDSLSPFFFALHRPIQVESIPASILVLMSFGGIMKLCIGEDFASVNVYGREGNLCNSPHATVFTVLSQQVLIIALLFFLCSVLYMTKLYLRKKLQLSHFYLAILLVFLAINKVFSPQYLFWILPLIAYIYGFDRVWVPFTTILGFLTTLIYPFFYGGTTLVKYFGLMPMLESILVRNVFFFVFVCAYISNIFNIRRKEERHGH